MQASVRILSVAAVGAAALALMLLAGAPAALAYDDPTPNQGNVIKAWNSRYTTVQFARKTSNHFLLFSSVTRNCNMSIAIRIGERTLFRS